jgi:hypothetical protein
MELWMRFGRASGVLIAITGANLLDLAKHDLVARCVVALVSLTQQLASNALRRGRRAAPGLELPAVLGAREPGAGGECFQQYAAQSATSVAR